MNVSQDEAPLEMQKKPLIQQESLYKDDDIDKLMEYMGSILNNNFIYPPGTTNKEAISNHMNINILQIWNSPLYYGAVENGKYQKHLKNSQKE